MDKLLTDEPERKDDQPQGEVDCAGPGSVKPSTFPDSANRAISCTAQGLPAPGAGGRPYLIGEARESKPKPPCVESERIRPRPHLEDIDQRADGDGVARAEAAQRVADSLMLVLADLEHRRGDLGVFSLTLDPPPARRALVTGALESLKGRLQGDEGLLLVEAADEDGRRHLHGIGILNDVQGLLAEWTELTSAVASAQRSVEVSGSFKPKPWEVGNSWLRKNLLGVLRYAFRRQFSFVSNFLGDRLALAAGSLAAPWEAAQAQHAPPEQAPSGRICQHCHRSLPTDMRPHAKYCRDKDRSCRTLASRDRRMRAAALTATNREASAEAVKIWSRLADLVISVLPATAKELERSLALPPGLAVRSLLGELKYLGFVERDQGGQFSSPVPQGPKEIT